MTDVLDRTDEETTEIPVVPTDADMADPAAPYGRKKDGTPKAKPGPRNAGGGASGTPRTAAAPKPRKATATRAKTPGVTDYRPGIMGLLQIPAMGLSMIGRQSKNAALQADGMTLAMHAGNIAEALNMTAQTQPQVAKALDNIMKAGPYGAILTAVVPLALQIAANHGVIPVNPQMGLHSPEDLVQASNAQMAAMAAGGSAAV